MLQLVLPPLLLHKLKLRPLLWKGRLHLVLLLLRLPTLMPQIQGEVAR